MFYLKVHRVTGNVMLAGCDKEILGKVLSDGDLDLTVSKGFYGGEEADEKKLFSEIGKASIVNLIGDRIVDAAVKEGLVDEQRVLTVCGVKHAQIVSLG